MIKLMTNGSEIVPYNLPEYPVYGKLGYISDDRDKRIACHWHDDLEFAVVLSGRMKYFVNGEHILLREGQGIFINSRSIHYNYVIDGESCSYFCVLIHPSVFYASEHIRRRCVDPIILGATIPHYLLEKGNPDAERVAVGVSRVLAAFKSPESALGPALYGAAFDILASLCVLLEGAVRPARTDLRILALQDMIGFVQSCYAEEISLSDIALAGRVSKSGCCAIFKRYLNRTPVGYLTLYRLERGVYLLRNSDMPISEVSQATGFASQSYFSEIFKREYGVTPTEYRRGVESR